MPLAESTCAAADRRVKGNCGDGECGGARHKIWLIMARRGARFVRGSIRIRRKALIESGRARRGGLFMKCRNESATDPSAALCAAVSPSDRNRITDQR